MSTAYEPNVAIIIRSKNDEKYSLQLLKSIGKARASYGGRIDILFVDTESSDSTTKYARQFGASVISISQKEFTYPKSLNLGLCEVSDDVDFAFLTVGHAIPVSPTFIKRGVLHFQDLQVTGVYGVTIPHDDATFTEKLLAVRYKNESRYISRINLGTLGATNAMIRMSVWRKYPFNESFAGGGEDTEWARQVFKRGESIVFDPDLNVCHSHGLGLIDSLRQWIHWRKIFNKPSAFKELKYRKKK